VKPLVDLFYASINTDVRSTCVAGLYHLCPDGPAPAPLLDSLSDSDPGVVLNGIFALHYFPNPLAVEPLCRFIESRVNVLFNENAMSALGEIGDERAVPVLVGVPLDTADKFDQSFGTAALALSSLGSAGFDALVAAVKHPDRRVRRAVAVGLDVSGDPRAGDYLDELESDPDPDVAARAKIRMGKR
jgi:HEAT repeat protein